MSFAWHEIRDHLMHSSSNLHFQRSFDAVRREQAALAAFRDPAALLDGLHRTPGDSARKNLILAALVRAAQGDGCASDVLLRLVEPVDFVDEQDGPLAVHAEAVRGLDLRRVNWIAATVLRNVERDMIRVRQRDQTREHLASGADPDEVADSGDSGIGAAGYARLNGAVRKLLGDDALLVIRVAIEGFSQAEVAAELGLTEAAARKRYQRAMRRLHDALEEIP